MVVLQGLKNGVKNWTAMPSIFPDGLEYVYDHTGWLVQGHNRFWSMNTDYAKQNGGDWNFLLDPTSELALPYDQNFWDFLMKSSREWGLTTYEQDWLDDEFDRFLPLTTYTGSYVAFTNGYCRCKQWNFNSILHVPLQTHVSVC